MSSLAPSGFSYYVTDTGDMWDSIAAKAYGPGAETLMNVLIDYNLTYQRTVIFDGGVQLLVPMVRSTTSLPAPPWKTIQQLGA